MQITRCTCRAGPRAALALMRLISRNNSFCIGHFARATSPKREYIASEILMPGIYGEFNYIANAPASAQLCVFLRKRAFPEGPGKWNSAYGANHRRGLVESEGGSFMRSESGRNWFDGNCCGVFSSIRLYMGLMLVWWESSGRDFCMSPRNDMWSFARCENIKCLFFQHEICNFRILNIHFTRILIPL